mmetsp:Transcript_141296/g.451598  ORF Transcript_141296/g.451598 Transcript_141296/m.451598 type:complete len:238 (-) Transcript_141296:1117-1830(-)
MHRALPHAPPGLVGRRLGAAPADVGPVVVDERGFCRHGFQAPQRKRLREQLRDTRAEDTQRRRRRRPPDDATGDGGPGIRGLAGGVAIAVALPLLQSLRRHLRDRRHICGGTWRRGRWSIAALVLPRGPRLLRRARPCRPGRARARGLRTAEELGRAGVLPGAVAAPRGAAGAAASDLVQVLVQAVQEESEELLRVVLLVAREVGRKLVDGPLQVPGVQRRVPASPQVCDDVPELLG